MNNNLLYNLPLELHRYIYSFLNPIALPYKKKSNINWCANCGEILVDGDWFMSFGNEESYLIYECNNCEESNIFYEYKLIDGIISNELN